MPRSPFAAPCAVAVALLAARATAAIPSASNSTVPSHVLLVGRLGADADTTTGAFTVVVRDFANNPEENTVVEFRILNCPGARLSSDPYDPHSTPRCGTLGVLQTTNLRGEVRMTAVGGGTPGAPPGAGPCAQIIASPGVLLGMATVAYLDEDGSGGLGANDLALWLSDLGSGESPGRSDFDGNGQLSATDLAIWLDVWSRGKSYQSPASYCPPAAPR